MGRHTSGNHSPSSRRHRSHRSISPPLRDKHERSGRGVTNPIRTGSGSPDSSARSRSLSPRTKRLKRAQVEREPRESERSERSRGSSRGRGSERDGVERREKRRTENDGGSGGGGGRSSKSEKRTENEDGGVRSNKSSRSRHERSPERERNGRSRHRSQSPPHHHASSGNAKPRDEMVNSSGAEEMDEENDSIRKMKAAAEALEEKQKDNSKENVETRNDLRKTPTKIFGCHWRTQYQHPKLKETIEPRDLMGTEFETIEARITSMLPQLQSECGILQRIVYKNKNQHRRSSYFQRLLKVRRDLRLLQSANLEELVTSCLFVIKGDKPRQKVILLESLKRRKCDGEKHNFMERLLGAARLLAEMVEPILKAASEVSVLFAQSFFMGFSLTIMALLARLRVLVQQILLDVVSLFNMVSALSITKQSTKITLNGIEVFRDFYPVSDDFVTLDCVWKSDKFILHEKKHKRKNESQAEDSNENVSVQASNVNYNSIESFLGDDQLEREEAHVAAKEDPCHIDNINTDLLTDSSQFDNKTTMYSEEGENQDNTKASINKSSQQAGLHASSRSSTTDKLHSIPKKVAFVSIKNLTVTRHTS